MNSDAQNLAALSPDVRLMASRVLAAMAVWDRKFGLVWGEDSDGVTTGDISAFLRVTPRTPERESLNTALTALRKAKLVHYETVGREPMRWWLTIAGLDVARKLPVGRSGNVRASGPTFAR